jgi:DNA-binding IclR family transcriptional regulator
MTEGAASATRRATAIRAAREHNYTAERVLGALEVIALSPSTAPAVAEAIGVHPRTARRILKTLAMHQYIEQRAHCGRPAHEYRPTVRLLAMATQAAARLPLVQHGRHVVRDLERRTRLTAYVAVPCYADVLVIACSGERDLRPWATLPAATDAAGRVLLANRAPWRHHLTTAEPDRAVGAQEAANIVQRGYALLAASDDRVGSQSVPVPNNAAPLAALAVRGASSELLANEDTLTALLRQAAIDLAAECGSATAITPSHGTLS